MRLKYNKNGKKKNSWVRKQDFWSQKRYDVKEEREESLFMMFSLYQRNNLSPTYKKITCKPINEPDKQTINQDENKLRHSRKGKLIILF